MMIKNYLLKKRDESLESSDYYLYIIFFSQFEWKVNLKSVIINL